MFTARYGLIPYTKQITFRLSKVKLDAMLGAGTHTSTPRPLFLGMSPSIHRAWGWVDLRDEMDWYEKSSPLTRVRIPNRQASSYWAIHRISRTIRRTFFPEKCDLNSTCVLYAEGKYRYTGHQDSHRYIAKPSTWRTAILVKVFSWSNKTARFSWNMQIPRYPPNSPFLDPVVCQFNPIQQLTQKHHNINLISTSISLKLPLAFGFLDENFICNSKVPHNHTAHETVIWSNTPINKFYRRQKKLDRTLTDQYFSTLRAYENIWTSNILWTPNLYSRCVCNTTV